MPGRGRKNKHCRKSLLHQLKHLKQCILCSRDGGDGFGVSKKRYSLRKKREYAPRSSSYPPTELALPEDDVYLSTPPCPTCGIPLTTYPITIAPPCDCPEFSLPMSTQTCPPGYAHVGCEVEWDCLRPSKSREVRASILLTRCDCLRRNGLQDDCPMQACQGSPECLTMPEPICGPANACRKYEYAQHVQYAPYTHQQCCCSLGCCNQYRSREAPNPWYNPIWPRKRKSDWQQF